MEFNFEDIINYLINEKIDFIATITSNWHAVGVDAFLLNLIKKTNKKLKGIIIINYHPISGAYVDETAFFCKKFVQVKFFYLKDPKFNFKGSFLGFKNILLSRRINNKQIHIISVLEPSFSSFRYFNNNLISKKYDPKFILIDEGFGTYVSKKAWKSVMIQESNYKYNIQSIIMIYFIKNFLSILKKFVFNIFYVEKRFIFKKKFNNLIPNNKVIDDYKAVLDIRNKNLKIDSIENDNIIILATEPLSECNMISSAMEIDIVNAITDIARRKGIYTIIKPHPREFNDKYSSIEMSGVQIIDNNFPLEELLARLHPICIIGYASTVLVNAKIFYEIDALNISEVAYKKSKNKALNEETADFKVLTSDFILQITELSQINDYLDSKL